MVHDLFPDRKDVTPKNLIKNMGVMNISTPLIGGMSLCNGAGGLSAQYLICARTGGAILIEGLLEICRGLFFSRNLLNIFTSFLLFIIAVMLLITSFELGKISFKVHGKTEIYMTVLTALLATVFNIAVGFIGGLIYNLPYKRR